MEIIYFVQYSLSSMQRAEPFNHESKIGKLSEENHDDGSIDVSTFMIVLRSAKEAYLNAAAAI